MSSDLSNNITIITYIFNNSVEKLVEWIKNIIFLFEKNSENVHFIIFTPHSQLFQQNYLDLQKIQFIHYPYYSTKLHLSIFSHILTFNFSSDSIFFISPYYTFHSSLCNLPLSYDLLCTFYIDKNLHNQKHNIITDFFGAKTNIFLNFIQQINHHYISLKVKEDYSLLDHSTVLQNLIPTLSSSYSIFPLTIHSLSIPIIQHIPQKYIIIHTMGGLGNLIFQIATCISLAIQHNRVPVLILNDKHKESHNHNSIYTYRSSHFRYHLFDKIPWIDINEINPSTPLFEETQFNYQHEIHSFIQNHSDENYIQLKGYYQSTPYFSDHLHTIIQQYFSHNFINKQSDLYFHQWKSDKNIINKKIVSVHIRGSDYLKFSNFHLCLKLSYYKNALETLFFNYPNTQFHFVIFTDDKEYVKSMNIQQYFNEFSFSFIHEEIYSYVQESYLHHLDEFEFYLLSKMDIMICANSSFSLFASYFSDSELIMIPDRWFVPDHPFVHIPSLMIPSKKYMMIPH